MVDYRVLSLCEAEFQIKHLWQHILYISAAAHYYSWHFPETGTVSHATMLPSARDSRRLPWFAMETQSRSELGGHLEWLHLNSAGVLTGKWCWTQPHSPRRLSKRSSRLNIEPGATNKEFGFSLVHRFTWHQLHICQGNANILRRCCIQQFLHIRQ